MLFAMLFLLVGTLLPSFVSSADVEDVSVLPENQVSAATGDKVKRKVTKKNENFQVEVEYGLDGYVVWDNPTLVKVTITCKNNFDGIIKVIPEKDYDVKLIAYGEDISLAAGEAKTFNFTLANLTANGKVNVSILNENEKVLYSEQDAITVDSSGMKTTIGVLSDDYSALNYFDGMAMQLGNYGGVTSTLELTQDSLPADSFALSILHYIIIDNFDTAHLSDEQYAALKEWVNNGGILVLSLGPNYQNVLHKFSDDFVSGRIGNLEKKDITWEELILESVDAVDAEVLDAKEMTTFSTDKTAFKKNVGAGAVVVLSYSLGMEPMNSFSGKQTVASLLIRSAATEQTESVLCGTNNAGFNNYGNNLASYANNTKKPSVLLYAILLIVYVLLVGPILYFILKAMKKREKIWLAIPTVACMFTGIIYLTGFLYQVKTAMVNTCDIISLDGNTKRERVQMNIICPKARRYQIDFGGGYSGYYNDMYEYNYSMFGTPGEDTSSYMLKKKGDGMEIIIDSSKAFKENNLVAAKTSENDIGSIDFDLKCYTTGFEGTVTNNTNYDLINVVVNFENYLYQAGDLKKGEQVKIDKSKIFQSMSYGTFDNIYATTYKDYYTNAYLNKLCQIDSMMEQVYVKNQGYEAGNIWAYVEDYQPDLVNTSKVKQNSFGIVHQSFKAQYEDVTGVFYPDITGMIVSGQGEYGKDDGYMYQPEVDITYSFENYPGVTALELTTFGLENINENPNEFYADVYAYNPSNGEYEKIFVTDAVLSGEKLKTYMNGNVIILRYVGKGDYYNNCIPRITARGDD